MKLPENIHLSTDSLCNDINNSQWSLYRGTTTIIQAVGSGVRPIYFKVPGEICIDPLEAMNGWRVFVSNLGDFTRFLKIDSEASDNSKEYEYYNACQYCKKIFTPIDSSTFISFIN